MTPFIIVNGEMVPLQQAEDGSWFTTLQDWTEMPRHVHGLQAPCIVDAYVERIGDTHVQEAQKLTAADRVFLKAHGIRWD